MAQILKLPENLHPAVTQHLRTVHAKSGKVGGACGFFVILFLIVELLVQIVTWVAADSAMSYSKATLCVTRQGITQVYSNSTRSRITVIVVSNNSTPTSQEVADCRAYVGSRYLGEHISDGFFMSIAGVFVYIGVCLVLFGVSYLITRGSSSTTPGDQGEGEPSQQA